MDRLTTIIKEHFDWDYIYAEESKKRDIILRKISDFQSEYPDLSEAFTDCFCKHYPNWCLSDWTQFYATDLHRCHRFLLENKQSNERYIFMVSIFEFFTVYRMSLTKEGDRYKYGDLVFINEGGNEFCDSVYNTCMPEKFIWLDSATLTTVIEELSSRNPHHPILINYANLLFTLHFNI